MDVHSRARERGKRGKKKSRRRTRRPVWERQEKRKDSLSVCVLFRGSRTTPGDAIALPRRASLALLRLAAIHCPGPKFLGPRRAYWLARRDPRWRSRRSFPVLRSHRFAPVRIARPRFSAGPARLSGPLVGAPSGGKATFAAGLLFLSRSRLRRDTTAARARTRRSPLVRFVSPATHAGRAVLVRGCRPPDHPVSALGLCRPQHPLRYAPVRPRPCGFY
jgi:hypothetical protein